MRNALAGLLTAVFLLSVPTMTLSGCKSRKSIRRSEKKCKKHCKNAAKLEHANCKATLSGAAKATCKAQAEQRKSTCKLACERRR